MNSIAKKVSLSYGLLLGSLGVLVSLIGYLLDLSYEVREKLGYIGMILIIAFIILIIKKYKSENGGYTGFGEAFKLSIRMAVIAGIVSAAYTFLYSTVIYPEYQDEILYNAEEKMTEQGQSEEAIELAMGYTEKFTSPYMLVAWGFLANIFISMIVALIVAAIMKNPKPVFEDTVD